MFRYLHERSYYEDIIDHSTVMHGRRLFASFEEFRKKFLEIANDQPPDSHRNVLHLNWFYMLMVGNSLLEHHDNRDSEIRSMMDRDQAKDEQVAAARLNAEPFCEHCGKTGLRIVSKDLIHRGDDYKYDDPEEVLFMLRCPSCQKNSAYWEDGILWEHRNTRCPKCKTIMESKDLRRNKVITTTYACLSCGHTYKSKLDLKPKEEDPDPDYERDRYIFCLQDKKLLEEHRDGKWRLDGIIRMGKEFKEKEENKHIYDAMSAMKKPKIPELAPLLSPIVHKAGYTEFGLDKPELGRNVLIGFSCMDSKTDRGDYDSRKTLQKLVRQALEGTNWRLTSDGISYRLGYLTGRLRAYEQEDDLKMLVVQDGSLKPEQRGSDAQAKKNARTIKSKNGEDIIL